MLRLFNLQETVESSAVDVSSLSGIDSHSVKIERILNSGLDARFLSLLIQRLLLIITVCF